MIADGKANSIFALKDTQADRRASADRIDAINRLIEILLTQREREAKRLESLAEIELCVIENRRITPPQAIRIEMLGL